MAEKPPSPKRSPRTLTGVPRDVIGIIGSRVPQSSLPSMRLASRGLRSVQQQISRLCSELPNMEEIRNSVLRFRNPTGNQQVIRSVSVFNPNDDSLFVFEVQERSNIKGLANIQTRIFLRDEHGHVFERESAGVDVINLRKGILPPGFVDPSFLLTILRNRVGCVEEHRKKYNNEFYGNNIIAAYYAIVMESAITPLLKPGITAMHVLGDTLLPIEELINEETLINNPEEYNNIVDRLHRVIQCWANINPYRMTIHWHSLEDIPFNEEVDEIRQGAIKQLLLANRIYAGYLEVETLPQDIVLPTALQITEYLRKTRPSYMAFWNYPEQELVVYTIANTGSITSNVVKPITRGKNGIEVLEEGVMPLSRLLKTKILPGLVDPHTLAGMGIDGDVIRLHIIESLYDLLAKLVIRPDLVCDNTYIMKSLIISQQKFRQKEGFGSKVALNEYRKLIDRLELFVYFWLHVGTDEYRNSLFNTKVPSGGLQKHLEDILMDLREVYNSF